MNRAFKYGDAVFETMKVVDGHIPFLDLHLQRLQQSADYLGLDYDESDLRIIIKTELASFKSGVFRAQVYRGGKSFYIGSNEVEIDLETTAEEGSYELNKNGLNIGLYIENYKATSPLYNLKSANYLLFVMARRYADKHGLDDALIVNGYGNIVEGINSNIVIIKDDKLISPDVDSGPVDGVMLKVLAKTGYKIERRAFDFQEVIDADHIFLCNAVKGVRWVNSFNGIEKSYWPEYPKMVQKLNLACGLKD